MSLRAFVVSCQVLRGLARKRARKVGGRSYPHLKPGLARLVMAAVALLQKGKRATVTAVPSKLRSNSCP
jgi:hypothetical protein